MKIKLPKIKAIRYSTGSKILKDAESIALKYYSSFSSKINIKLKRTKNYKKCMEVVKTIKKSSCYKKSTRRYRGCRRANKKAYIGAEEYEDSDAEQTKKDLEESEAEKPKPDEIIDENKDPDEKDNDKNENKEDNDKNENKE